MVASMNEHRLHRYNVPHGDDYTAATLAKELSRRQQLKEATSAWDAEEVQWEGFVHAWLSQVMQQRYKQLAAYQKACQAHREAGHSGEPALESLSPDAAAGLSESEVAEAVQDATAALQDVQLSGGSAKASRQVAWATDRLRELPAMALDFGADFDAAEAGLQGRTVPESVLLAPAPGSAASRLTEAHAPYVLLERLPEAMDSTPLLRSSKPSRRPLPADVDPTSYTLLGLMQMRDPDLALVRAVWRREAELPEPPSLEDMAALSRPLQPDGPGAVSSSASGAHPVAPWIPRDDTLVLPAAKADPRENAEDNAEATMEAILAKELGSRGAAGEALNLGGMAMREEPYSGAAELARQASRFGHGPEDAATKALLAPEPEDAARLLVAMDEPSEFSAGLASLMTPTASMPVPRSQAEVDAHRSALVLLGKAVSGQATADELRLADAVADDTLRRAGLAPPAGIVAQGRAAEESYYRALVLGDAGSAELTRVQAEIEASESAAEAEAELAEREARPMNATAAAWVARKRALSRLAGELTRRGVRSLTDGQAPGAGSKAGKKSADISAAVRALPLEDQQALANDPASELLGSLREAAGASSGALRAREEAVDMRIAQAHLETRLEASAERMVEQSEGLVRPPVPADGESWIRPSSAATTALAHFAAASSADAAAAAGGGGGGGNGGGNGDAAGGGGNGDAAGGATGEPGAVARGARWEDAGIAPGPVVSEAGPSWATEPGARPQLAGGVLDADGSTTSSSSNADGGGGGGGAGVLAGAHAGGDVAPHKWMIQEGPGGKDSHWPAEPVFVEESAKLPPAAREVLQSGAQAVKAYHALMERAGSWLEHDAQELRMRPAARSLQEILAEYSAAERRARLGASEEEIRSMLSLEAAEVVDSLRRNPGDPAAILHDVLTARVRRARRIGDPAIGAGDARPSPELLDVDDPAALEALRKWSDVVGSETVIDYLLERKPLDTAPLFMRQDLRKALGVREHARLTAERMRLARDVLSRTSAERGVILPPDGLDAFVRETDPHTGPMAARARDKGGSLRDDILDRIHAGVARVMQADYDLVMAGAPEAQEAADPTVRAAMAKIGEAQEAVAHPTRDLEAEAEALESTRAARSLEAEQAATERARALALAGHHADAVAAAKEALLLRTGFGDLIEQHDRPRAVAEAETVLHAQAAADAEAQSMAEEFGLQAGTEEHASFVADAKAALVKTALARKRAQMAAARNEEAATAPDVVHGSSLAAEAAAAKPEALLPESFKKARDALVAAQEKAARLGRQLRSRQRGQRRREQAQLASGSGDGSPPAVAPVARGAQDTEALQASHEEALAQVAEATKVTKQQEKELAAMQKDARRLDTAAEATPSSSSLSSSSLSSSSLSSSSLSSSSLSSSSSTSSSTSTTTRAPLDAAVARFQQQYGVQPSRELASAARRAQAELEALRGVPLAELDAEADATAHVTGSVEQELDSAAHVGVAADQPMPSPAQARAPEKKTAFGAGVAKTSLRGLQLAREVGESLAPLPRAAFGEVENDGTGSGTSVDIVMAPQSLVDATVAMQKESPATLSFDPFVVAAEELAQVMAGEVNASTILADPELQRLREEARGEVNRGEAWVEPRQPYGGSSRSREAGASEAKADDAAAAAAANAEAFVSGKDAAEAEAGAEAGADASTPAKFRAAPGMLPRVTPSDDELDAAGVDGMIAAVEFEDDIEAADGANGDGDAVEEGESDEETRLLLAGRMGDLTAHPDELSGGEDEDSEANEPDLGDQEGELDPAGAPVSTSLAGFLADDGMMDFVPRASQFEEVQDAALAAAEDEQLRLRAAELEQATSRMQGLTQEQRLQARREMADAKAVLAGSAPEVLSLFAGRETPLSPAEAKAYLEGVEAQFGPDGRTPDGEQRLVHIAALHEEQQRLAEGRPFGQPSSMFREIFRDTALGSQVDAQLAAKGLSPSAPASAFVRGGELPISSWRGAAAEAAAPVAEARAMPVPDAARTEAIMRLSGEFPAGSAELFALNAAQRFLERSYASDVATTSAPEPSHTGATSTQDAAGTSSEASGVAGGETVELEAGAPLTAEALRLATWSRWERSTEEMARQLHETARAEAAELEASPASGLPSDSMDASPGEYLADGRSQNPDDDFVDQVLPREGVQLYARASAHTATVDSAARATDLSTFLHRLNMGVTDTAVAAAQRQASEAVLALARTRASRDMPAGTALLPRGGGARASHGTADDSGVLRPGARAVGAQDPGEIAQELLEGVPLAASSDVHRAVSTEAIGAALEAAAAADSAMQRLVSAPAHKVVLRARAASAALDASAQGQAEPPADAGASGESPLHKAALDGGMVGEEEHDVAALVRAVRKALDRGQPPGVAGASSQHTLPGESDAAESSASEQQAGGALPGTSTTGLGRDEGMAHKLFGDSVTALELAAGEARSLSGSAAGAEGTSAHNGGGTSELPEGWRGVPALAKTTSMSARLRRAQLLTTSGRRVDMEHVMTATFRHAQEQQPWDLHHSINYEAHHFRMLEAVQHRDLDSALQLFRAATMRRGARMLLSGKDSDDRAEADVRGSGEYAGQPDWLAANILLDAAARARCPSVAQEAIAHIVGRGGAIGPDQLTLLLKGASLRGDLAEARQLYARIAADGKRPRLADHAAMMAVQFHNGQHRRALATLNHVIRSGEAPTAHMFATALRYLSRDDRYEEMHHVWKALQLSPAIKPSARTLSRLVRSFARGGRLDDAWEVFLAMRSAAHGRVVPDKDTLIILYTLLLDNGRTQHARRMLSLLDSLGHLGPKPGSRSHRARRRSGDIDAAMNLRHDLEAALHAAEDGPAESGQRMRIRGIVDSAPRYGVPYLPEDAQAEKRRWASVWQRSTIDLGAADAFFGDDQGRRGADGHAFVPPGSQSVDDEMEDTLEQAVADSAFRR